MLFKVSYNILRKKKINEVYCIRMMFGNCFFLGLNFFGNFVF